MADVADKPVEKVEEKDKSSTENQKSENGGVETKKPLDEEQTEQGDEEKPDEGKEEPDEDKEKPDDDEEKSDDALSKLESSIIRQVEYYFGDANLNRDKFLLEQIKKEAEGWVPLSVLLTFKRLAALSTDADVIVDALLKSDEDLLEISEDRTKIRRHPERPIPEHNEEHRKEIMSRTVYVKGFPLDAQIDEILEFFTPYEKVLNVTMRKYCDKSDKKYKFKGSVFATFEKKEQTQSFVEKDGLSYKDRPLIRKWQDKYLVEKREEREREKALKEKKKKAKAKPEERKIVLPKGTVLHFEGVTQADIKRELLRDVIEKIDVEFKVAYIEFNQGDKEGHIRFHEEGAAEKFLAKLEDKKLKINDDVEITLRALAEAEETEFLDKVVDDMMKMRNNPNKRGYDKGGNRKRKFGNFNNSKGKKHKFDNDD